LVGERYGLVIIPKFRDGKYDYSQAPLMISMTTRPSSKKNHFNNMSSVEKKYILRYCKEVADVDYGESAFLNMPNDYKLQRGEFWVDRKSGLIEKVIVPGIGNDMQTRNTLNIDYFVKLGKFLTEQPVNFKPQFMGIL
jgi:hypothetical protein